MVKVAGKERLALRAVDQKRVDTVLVRFQALGICGNSLSAHSADTGSPKELFELRKRKLRDIFSRLDLGRNAAAQVVFDGDGLAADLIRKADHVDLRYGAGDTGMYG